MQASDSWKIDNNCLIILRSFLGKFEIIIGYHQDVQELSSIFGKAAPGSCGGMLFKSQVRTILFYCLKSCIKELYRLIVLHRCQTWRKLSNILLNFLRKVHFTFPPLFVLTEILLFICKG